MGFLYITSLIFFDHLTGDHPENPKRLDSINAEVEKIIPQDEWLKPRDATIEEISAIHIVKYINGFKIMTEHLVNFAEKNCGGEVVSFLKGGYNLTTLGKTVAQHIKVLKG